MSNRINVSQATIYDLDELAILFDQYRMHYNQTSDMQGARAFLFDRLEHRESVILIAREDKGQPIQGFTQLYPSFSSISMQRSWILNDLYVSDAYRQQGVGTALLQYARDYALLTRAKGIELCTMISNTTAKRLYEAVGYQKDEEYSHYYLTIEAN